MVQQHFCNGCPLNVDNPASLLHTEQSNLVRSEIEFQASCVLQEASMMATVRHPNMVSYLGLCMHPPCIVTEYCAGGSLYNVLKWARQRPLLTSKLTWARRWRGSATHKDPGLFSLGCVMPGLAFRLGRQLRVVGFPALQPSRGCQLKPWCSVSLASAVSALTCGILRGTGKVVQHLCTVSACQHC